MLQEETAIEEALWVKWERQAVDVVQPHGRNGQRQSSWGSGQRPSARPPALGQTQTQKSPTVSCQGREGGRLHTDPISMAAPFLSQRNGPVERFQQEMLM